MKVIKDNYQKFPKEVTCKNCGSVILLEDSNDVIVQNILGRLLGDALCAKARIILKQKYLKTYNYDTKTF